MTTPVGSSRFALFAMRSICHWIVIAGTRVQSVPLAGKPLGGRRICERIKNRPVVPLCQRAASMDDLRHLNRSTFASELPLWQSMSRDGGSEGPGRFAEAAHGSGRFFTGPGRGSRGRYEYATSAGRSLSAASRPTLLRGLKGSQPQPIHLTMSEKDLLSFLAFLSALFSIKVLIGFFFSCFFLSLPLLMISSRTGVEMPGA